ncbi:MAG: cupin-like domain-containing protein [Rhizobiaceae bacterium]|nr:cupin-like domain-containing protein [Rhizobiaceae bacterium]
MRDNSIGNILSNWESHHASLFGEHSLKLRHSLDKSRLFSDKALIALLENVPREHYHVTTMEKGAHNPGYKREGDFGDLSGEEILEAVKRGSLWINFQNPDKIGGEYGELLRDIYAEFEARVPGLKTYKHKMTILISSPNLKVKYHFDLPGQTLWQIRGKKRVYVYPPKAPFLTRNGLEKVTINEAHETDLQYHEWFDDHAEVYELEPGQMLHWPLNCPHRIENHDCLNVSLTTEHWTKPLRNIYAVNYGNAMLRKLGLNRLAEHTGPANLYPKAAITAATKLTGMQERQKKPFMIDFVVDPSLPDCIRNIEPFQLDT